MSRGRTRGLALLVALPLLVGACTHVYTVRPGDRADANVIQLEDRGREMSGTIHRFEGDPIPFQSVEVSQDAVVWVSPDQGILREIPADQASYIEFVDPRRGAAEGVALGLGVGFLLGSMWGLTTFDGGETDPLNVRICLDRCSKTEHVFSNGVAGAFLGGALGVTLGAIRGTRLRYELLLGPL